MSPEPSHSSPVCRDTLADKDRQIIRGRAPPIHGLDESIRDSIGALARVLGQHPCRLGEIELLTSVVARLDQPIGVEQQHVPDLQRPLFFAPLPYREDAQQGVADAGLQHFGAAGAPAERGRVPG